MKIQNNPPVVFVLFLCFMASQYLWASPPVHGITGSGVVEEDDIIFRTTLAAFHDVVGRVWGTQVVKLDLTAFDLGVTTFKSELTCLHVNGESAWVGALVTASSNEDIIGLGTYTITLVRDLGGEGEDIMHGEPFDLSVDCADEPALPETLVLQGNYRVR